MAACYLTIVHASCMGQWHLQQAMHAAGDHHAAGMMLHPIMQHACVAPITALVLPMQAVTRPARSCCTAGQTGHGIHAKACRAAGGTAACGRLRCVCAAMDITAAAQISSQCRWLQVRGSCIQAAIANAHSSTCPDSGGHQYTCSWCMLMHARSVRR
jgi:hypothetical protein